MLPFVCIQNAGDRDSVECNLEFNFKFVTAGSNDADYLLHDLSLRCEPLETEYDDYMTYYQNMEYQNELPSFKEFFKKAHYRSDLVFAGYQSKPAFLRDFEQKFVTRISPLSPARRRLGFGSPIAAQVVMK